MDSIESRRARRKDITLKGTFKIVDDLKYKFHIYKEPIDLTISDVAVLGCGFITGYYLPKGLHLFVSIKGFPILSGKGVKETEDMEFTGKVMVCKTTQARGHKVGIEFLEIKKEYQSLIKKFVEA